MQNKNYTIRIMNRKEIDIAIEWTAKEGWNQGIYDADWFYAADQSGVLIEILV